MIFTYVLVFCGGFSAGISFLALAIHHLTRENRNEDQEMLL